MKAIFLVLIFLVLGVLFGFIFARIMLWLSNYILSRKITKDVLNNPKPFFYKDKPYNLKEQIEYERKQRKTFIQKIKGIFKKKTKGGISQYGSAEQPGNIGSVGGEPISDSNSGSPASNPSPAIPPASPGEQIRLNSPESRGERRNINRNLFEKGK